MMTLGERIRTARQLSGLSQRALGLKCGYSEASAEASIQHIESGRRLPPIWILRPLSDALGISLDALFPAEVEHRRKALQCNGKESE